MNRTNPLYVPRNYLAQLAIDDADRGDFQRLHTWMRVLENPYTWQEGMDEYAEKRPEGKKSLRVFHAFVQLLAHLSTERHNS